MLAEIGYAVLASAMVWAGVHVVIKCNQYGVGSAWMKVNLLLLLLSLSSWAMLRNAAFMACIRANTAIPPLYPAQSVQRKGSWTASWHHWISMVKKEQLAQLQERSGMPDAALYAAERNIWYVQTLTPECERKKDGVRTLQYARDDTASWQIWAGRHFLRCACLC